VVRRKGLDLLKEPERNIPFSFPKYIVDFPLGKTSPETNPRMLAMLELKTIKYKLNLTMNVI
jgi:hypothetical protein